MCVIVEREEEVVIFEGGREGGTEGVCVIVERGRGKEEGGTEGVCVIVERAGGGSSLSIGPVPRTPPRYGHGTDR